MPSRSLFAAGLDRLDRAALRRTASAAQQSVEAWSDAAERHGSLLQEWIKGDEVRVDKRYPDPDIVDRRNGCQFFYHCHRHSREEHGHVHIFYHARASGARRYIGREKQPWHRTAPTHLLAIGLDNRGVPVSLFTVNRWVTDGFWFDAATTLGMVDRFHMNIAGDYGASATWLTGFVRMYRPAIEQLLHRRDQVIARIAKRTGLSQALESRRHELLSRIDVNWLADIEHLESRCGAR